MAKCKDDKECGYGKYCQNEDDKPYGECKAKCKHDYHCEQDKICVTDDSGYGMCKGMLFYCCEVSCMDIFSTWVLA